MSQSLCINKKEYLPSTVLAKQFKYSSDYISKLARDEKILATRVGRQWFAEPESLRVFALQADVESRMRQSLLSRERKTERNQQSGEVEQGTLLPNVHNANFSAFAQSVAVLACGFCVGGVSWMYITSDFHTRDFALNARTLASAFVSSTVPDFSIAYRSNFFAGSNEALLFGTRSATPDLEPVSQIISQESLDGVFTTLPVFSDENALRLEIPIQQTQTTLESTQKYFSDEVIVSPGSDAYVVQPVFRDSAGKKYEFSLVPVPNKSHNE